MLLRGPGLVYLTNKACGLSPSQAREALSQKVLPDVRPFSLSHRAAFGPLRAPPHFHSSIPSGNAS